MSYDFNGAERQSNGFDPIPAGTVVPLTMNIRPGGAGEGGWFKQSGSSDALMLDCEFTVTEGRYARRKIWQYLVVSGGKLNERGESTAGNITRSMLRAILESARNIMPDDAGERAQNARRVNGWQDFCGMTFLAKLGVEKDRTGQYPDRNRIQTVVTPDMKDYGSPTTGEVAPQTAPFTNTPSASGATPWGGAQPSEAMYPPQSAAQPASDPVPAWAR